MSWEPWTTLATRHCLRRIDDPEPAQRALLRRILASGAGSATAAALGLKGDESFEEFLELEPRDYTFYEPLVRRARDGDRHAFGRDPVIALGMTSGSTGAPKLVPYNDRCREVFRRFVRLVRLFQLARGRSFWPRRSKWLMVTAPSGLREVDGLPVGFVSGLMFHEARSSGPWGPGVLPSAEVAAVADWDDRVRRAAAEALGEPVGTLFGVPAYLERFLREASSQAGDAPLGEAWPDLDEIHFSGTSAAPHRAEIEAILGRAVDWRGLFMATEGVFGAALDDDADGALRLIPDLAVMTFRDAAGGPLRPLWQLERGRCYELLITTEAGLAQYRIGDLIEVVDDAPLRVRVAGRVGDEINLATEKLSCGQALAVLAEVAPSLGLAPDRFTVLPDPSDPRRHLWVIERSGSADGDGGAGTAAVAIAIDGALARVNPSYAALRAGDAVLARPRAALLPRGTFDEYVRAGFARCGQFKFRHLYPSREALLRAEGMEAIAASLPGDVPPDGRPSPR
jgi:acyl-CoA synthetase (AMP-forming)/AMP-acid ligase II